MALTGQKITSNPIYTNCVANDFCTAFTNSQGPDAYATIGTVDQALKVPLGSQLALLNAQMMGNMYVDYGRVQNMMAPPLTTLQMGYNRDMGQNLSSPYFTFAQAYSTKL